MNTWLLKWRNPPQHARCTCAETPRGSDLQGTIKYIVCEIRIVISNGLQSFSKKLKIFGKVLERKGFGSAQWKTRRTFSACQTGSCLDSKLQSGHYLWFQTHYSSTVEIKQWNNDRWETRVLTNSKSPSSGMRKSSEGLPSRPPAFPDPPPRFPRPPWPGGRPSLSFCSK